MATISRGHRASASRPWRSRSSATAMNTSVEIVNVSAATSSGLHLWNVREKYTSRSEPHRTKPPVRKSPACSRTADRVVVMLLLYR